VTPPDPTGRVGEWLILVVLILVILVVVRIVFGLLT
jgi:hypothetical protein